MRRVLLQTLFRESVTKATERRDALTVRNPLQTKDSVDSKKGQNLFKYTFKGKST
jgi:hypothetical protein